MNILMRYYGLAELGVLPEAGGWNDQANVFTQALSYVRAGVAEVESERMKQARKPSRRGTS